MLMFANAQCELTIRNYSVISIDKFVRVVTNWCETQIFYEDICFFESLSKLLLCGYLLDMGKRSFISPPKGHFKLKERGKTVFTSTFLSPENLNNVWWT